MSVTFYSYNVSPYAAKVRAILQFKKVPFREEVVHPLRRGGIKAKSGQVLVPIIDHDGKVVADSTAIAQYLEEKFPEPAVLPADPAERGRAKLLEEWADEGLAAVVQPVRWLIPYNYRENVARMRSAYPPGRADDLVVAAAGRTVQLTIAKRFGPRFGFGRPARYLNRLAEVMDYLDAVLKPTGYLVGDKPTVADFAVYGFLSQLEGLDGWETIRARRRVAKLIKTLQVAIEGKTEEAKPKASPEGEAKPIAKAAPAAGAEAYDAHDQALIDASRLRRAKT
jgi:glutathione S-transferase